MVRVIGTPCVSTSALEITPSLGERFARLGPNGVICVRCVEVDSTETVRRRRILQCRRDDRCGYHRRDPGLEAMTATLFLRRSDDSR